MYRLSAPEQPMASSVNTECNEEYFIHLTVMVIVIPVGLTAPCLSVTFAPCHFHCIVNMEKVARPSDQPQPQSPEVGDLKKKKIQLLS